MPYIVKVVPDNRQTDATCHLPGGVKVQASTPAQLERLKRFACPTMVTHKLQPTHQEKMTEENTLFMVTSGK